MRSLIMQFTCWSMLLLALNRCCVMAEDSPIEIRNPRASPPAVAMWEDALAAQHAQAMAHAVPSACAASSATVNGASCESVARSAEVTSFETATNAPARSAPSMASSPVAPSIPARRPARPPLPASARGRPLVTLVMIVKNEVRSLRSTLNSVLGFVDRYSILDTGSTDGSIELMDRFAAEHQLRPDQWALHHGPFTDFSTTRNEALRLAGNVSEFILFLNGDDRLVGGRRMRVFLEERRHLAKRQDEAMYIVDINYGGISHGRSERISRSANHFVPGWPSDPLNHWRYEGVTHEVYVCQSVLQSGAEMVYVPAELFSIYHDVTFDTLDAKEARFRLDVSLLLEEINEHPDRAHTARSIYYLAQSYLNLGEEKEAFHWYSRRLASDYPRRTPRGEDHEKSRSAAILATLAQGQGGGLKDVQSFLEKAHAYCPTSYTLLQLARFHAELKRDPSTALGYARKSRDLLVSGRASVVCGDDAQIVAQQLPALMDRIQRDMSRAGGGGQGKPTQAQRKAEKKKP